MDINSFVTGFSMGKKKGGSAILTELVVTENGVYDEPVIGGGLEPITWDGVVGDRVSVDLFGNGVMLAVKISDKLLTAVDCIGGELCVSFAGTDAFVSIDDNLIVERWGATLIMTSRTDNVPSVWSVTDTEQIYASTGWEFTETGTYFTFGTDNSVCTKSLTFAGAPPTPADGWNKVTVNVAGDIVDVPELPTENIEEGKIYRVTTVSEGSVTYYISDGATSQTLEELADSIAGPGQYLRGVYTIVDELPENPPDHDGSNMTVPVYVIRETGEGFVHTSDGLVPLIDMANMVFQVEYSYMGIVNTVGDMTQAGYYAIMTPAQSSVTYGIPDANPVKRLVDGAWVDLT